MMYIDDPRRILVHELRRQNLHVSSQHYQVNTDPIKSRERFSIMVIADD